MDAVSTEVRVSRSARRVSALGCESIEHTGEARRIDGLVLPPPPQFDDGRWWEPTLLL